MSSENVLLKIKESMKHYSLVKKSIGKHQLDFLAEEVSRKLERAKKINRTMELFVGISPAIPFVLDIPEILSTMRSKDEIKKSLIKKLEENFTFLNNSKVDIEKSLLVLFESWESYFDGNNLEAMQKAEESKLLTSKAKKNCLIGITRELIRNTETKISVGRRHFASVKEARKILDDVKLNIQQVDENPQNALTDQDDEILEKIILEIKKAERDAQYAIDDAKMPFIVNIIAVIFGIMGGIWAVYSVLSFLKII